MADRGIVIVGAGECGSRAAFALREEGYAGSITLIGAEPHLPYERPPLSKQGLLENGSARKEIAERARFDAAGIELLLSAEVVAIDRAAHSVQLRDAGWIAYEKLLLATGARPRRLSMAAGIGRVVTLRTHDDAEAISAHLSPGAVIAILGGGVIGLEIAAAARHRGCEVVVIEMQTRLLARAVPAEIALVVEQAHRRHGVDLRLGRGLSAISEMPSCIRLTLDDGSAVEAELCIAGIGAEPNTELAQPAGLAVENGISVDARLSTSDPDIFAAGDCCSFPLAIYGGRRVRLEAWRNALEQGALAAKTMLGRKESHAAVPWFWSDQYDLTLQIAGLADESASTVRRDIGDDAFILFHLAGDGRLVAASGVGSGNAVARDIRLAEMLIARGARPSPKRLASPETKLKSLLAA